MFMVELKMDGLLLYSRATPRLFFFFEALIIREIFYTTGELTRKRSANAEAQHLRVIKRFVVDFC